jgi:signal transduction histidine kinase
MTKEQQKSKQSIHDEIGELTRQKVVRQLHDGLTQTVSALAMRINYARRMMPTDPEVAAEELEKVEDLTRAATKEIRHIIFLLRPESQREQDLKSNLESLTEKMGDLFNLDIEMDIRDDLVNRLSPDVQDVVYGLIEELIDNIRKHQVQAKVLLKLDLLKRDFAQLFFTDRTEGILVDNTFDVIDINLLQIYADLIDGSVIVDKEAKLVQVLFPIRWEKDY